MFLIVSAAKSTTRWETQSKAQILIPLTLPRRRYAPYCGLFMSRIGPFLLISQKKLRFRRLDRTCNLNFRSMMMVAVSPRYSSIVRSSSCFILQRWSQYVAGKLGRKEKPIGRSGQFQSTTTLQAFCAFLRLYMALFQSHMAFIYLDNILCSVGAYNNGVLSLH